ncbi:MAG TPA: FAD binding domain-containing protein [Rectinemataceae bacterium]|nr:FAD binding domain-containing protein [Rectinemataceae bacterium]
MEIGRYERPKTMDEAYSLIVGQRGLPIAGGAWTHLAVKKAALVVDLSDLDLRYIRDSGDAIEIGAMATARDLEISPLLTANFGNLFREATSHLVGVQLRNVITAGGTVAGKFGFSDLVTALTALNASLCFYGAGCADMAGFLTAPRDKPFLLEKIVVKKGAAAAFQSLRATANDFAILNACAAFVEGAAWRVAVGARPAVSRLSPAAAEILGREGAPGVETAGRAGAAAAAELSFGEDTRGSAEYRRDLCAVLVKRAVMEASR